MKPLTIISKGYSERDSAVNRAPGDHGVAILLALGLLDLDQNALELMSVFFRFVIFDIRRPAP